MFTLRRIVKSLSANETAAFSQLRTLATAIRQRRSDLTPEDELNIVQNNWEQRCELATAYRALEMYGMSEGICNHLTAKAPSLYKEEGVVLVIPYGMYWSQVTPEELLGIDMKTGALVEGGENADETAFSIHLGIYKHRPDINSIMHTHPRYSTTLAVLEDPTMQMISQNAARFYDNVAYDKGYDGIATAGNDEGDRLGEAIGDKEVLLMGNHGLVTGGKNVGIAFDLHYYFERAAETQILAYQTGKPLSYLPDHVVQGLYKYLGQEWQDSGEVEKHLRGLQSLFRSRDPAFADPAKAEYLEYVK